MMGSRFIPYFSIHRKPSHRWLDAVCSRDGIIGLVDAVLLCGSLSTIDSIAIPGTPIAFVDKEYEAHRENPHHKTKICVLEDESVWEITIEIKPFSAWPDHVRVCECKYSCDCFNQKRRRCSLLLPPQVTWLMMLKAIKGKRLEEYRQHVKW